MTARVCRVIVALAMLTSPGAAFAQPPTAVMAGTVVDSRTHVPLAGATVELRDPPQSAATDAQGRFRFDAVPVGRHDVFVSVVGYAFAKFGVDVAPEGADVTLSLTEGAAAYNETVTVQGDVFGVREPGVAGQQTLASGELRQLGGMTLDDPLRAVQALSGAYASDDFYGELAVRGHGFSRLNYTIDGAPAAFLLHTLKFVEDGASVTMVNGDAIEHATLLRGGYPQRFDDRLGAALAFTASGGSRGRPRGNATASGTSASFTADGPLGTGSRGSWIVSARRSYLDLFLKRVLDDDSLAFGFGDVYSKVAYDVTDRDQLQASVVVGSSRFDRPPVPGSPLNLARANHAGWMVSGAWRHTNGSTLTLSQRLFATGESFDNRNGLDAQVAGGRGSDIGYRMDVSYAPAASRLFEAGWSVERLGAREQLVFRVPGWHITGGEDFDAHALKGGGYGQVRLSAGAFGVTPGVRVARFGLTDDWAASPWLQADWQASSRVALLFNAGLHHQAPEFAQVVGRRGNTNLGLERAMHVDAGIEARVNATTRTQITVYDREEHDVTDLPDQYYRLIDGVVTQQSDTSRWENRLQGRARGLELMLQRKSPDGLSGWVAYSVGRTEYRDRVTGEAFDGDFDQRHTFTLFAYYRISERTSVNTRWRYGSNRPMTGYIEQAPDGQYFVGPTRNAVRVPAYSRLDARADRTFRFGSRRLTLFAEVGNILNRTNYRQIPSSIDPRTGRIFEPLDTMYPFVPSLGATFEF